MFCHVCLILDHINHVEINYNNYFSKSKHISIIVAPFMFKNNCSAYKKNLLFVHNFFSWDAQRFHLHFDHNAVHVQEKFIASHIIFIATKYLPARYGPNANKIIADLNWRNYGQPKMLFCKDCTDPFCRPRSSIAFNLLLMNNPLIK